MRHIGTLSRRDLAERFHDYLISQGKKSSLEEEAGGIALWVHDDDAVAWARGELAEFNTNPDAPKYLAARKEASVLLRAEAERRKAARQNTVSMARRWDRPANVYTPVTMAVMVVCVFVFTETFVLNDQQGLFARLTISTDGSWREIQSGEWWRLLTPAIMHGGVLHIVMNLMAWWTLARPVEYRKGSLTLLLLILVIAAISNTLQFVFKGPNFLGLSGVVFGIFGYRWIKGQLDPDDGLGLSPDTIRSCLIFLIACFFIPNMVANYAHVGGLVAGVMLGALSAAWRNRRHLS